MAVLSESHRRQPFLPASQFSFIGVCNRNLGIVTCFRVDLKWPLGERERWKSLQRQQCGSGLSVTYMPSLPPWENSSLSWSFDFLPCKNEGMVGWLSEGWHAWKGHNILRAWQSAWHLVDTQERLPVRRIGLAGAGRQWVEDTIYATPNVTQCLISQWTGYKSLVFFFFLGQLEYIHF